MNRMKKCLTALFLSAAASMTSILPVLAQEEGKRESEERPEVRYFPRFQIEDEEQYTHLKAGQSGCMKASMFFQDILFDTQPVFSSRNEDVFRIEPDGSWTALNPGVTTLSTNTELGASDWKKMEERFPGALFIKLMIAQLVEVRVECETKPMLRLYNPNSGEHFYTVSAREKEYLVKEGWQDEGVGWMAPIESSLPVYRLYNPNAGDHHYSRDEKERNHLIECGWQDEGIAFYSAGGSDEVLYRLYNPNAQTGAHHFTKSWREVNYLSSLGWQQEEIGWYGMQ